jgi:hypothetical protein
MSSNIEFSTRLREYLAEAQIIRLGDSMFPVFSNNLLCSASGRAAGNIKITEMAGEQVLKTVWRATVMNFLMVREGCFPGGIFPDYC